MFFIHSNEVPQGVKIAYCNIVCGILLQKKETDRVIIKVGGDKLTFELTVSTPTPNPTTSKLHRNSILLTPFSKYLVVDVKNFYLNKLIYKHDYYKIALRIIP